MKLSGYAECPNCQRTLAFRTEIDVDRLSPELRSLVAAVLLNHRVVRCPNCNTLSQARTIPPLPDAVRIELVQWDEPSTEEGSEPPIRSFAEVLNMARGTEGIE